MYVCVVHEYTSLVRAVPPLLWQKRSTFCSTSFALPTTCRKKRNSRLDRPNLKQPHALPMAITHVGHGKVNSNCFHNSETIAISIAINVTVRDECAT